MTRSSADPSCLALFPELLQDLLRLDVEAAFDDREELLVGGKPDGAGDVGEDGALHETDIHDVQSRQLSLQFSGDMDSVGDGRFSVIGAVGGNKNVLDH